MFLDLRGIQPGSPATDWLLSPHPLWAIGAVYDEQHPENYQLNASMAKTFDVLVYFQHTTPSQLLRLSGAHLLTFEVTGNCAAA
jgi:hypothetical protein